MSLSELLLGVEVLPVGKRKQDLAQAVRSLVEGLFSSRILPFDTPAAIEYANRVANARSSGLVVSRPDAQIAAIAAARGYKVATRDTPPFLAMGVPVINPWLE